ncbi:class I SAM-dependent methyltransferase [Paenibacillus harenae]|uniref:2-polyprenyl-3-methyl-5-hydroxy-6-metoxy-1, 4-benzoquinol methylase n=1 Tax=Paenibacillus harenae TaxID=306543 RepID=A0ABT9U468_PAEHA|nr:methyltransferase domain-containing protein [Paenibacillus harenae]MDQ0114042.1 2-polyprenyl-3-methyl-5-hydroxy-6-metoxy-1,4-benzoquinol methylase [Paenibacillus harenae]
MEAIYISNSDSVRRLIDKAHDFNQSLLEELAEGKITEEDWFEINNKYFTEHYLASDNPRSQSGHGGNEQGYFHSHQMLIDVIHKSGTFIDVGCANGYLLESLHRWITNLGYYKLVCYGLDISQGLIELAKKRLPEWSNHFYTGNAVNWAPKEKFDFVCVKELDYAVPGKQQLFLKHLFEHFVKPNGRLILGPYSEETSTPTMYELVTSWGYKPTGYIERSNYKHHDISRRLLWWDL